MSRSVEPFVLGVGGGERLELGRAAPPWFADLAGPSFSFAVCARCSDTLPSGARCPGCPVSEAEEASREARYPTTKEPPRARSRWPWRRRKD